MASALAWLVRLALLGGTLAGPGPPDSPSPAAPPAGLRFEHAVYNVSIPENSAGRTRAVQPPGEPPLGVRLPAPGARVRFRIRHGDKDKLFKAEERSVGDFCFLTIRTRPGRDVLNRERRDSYRLEVRASAATLAGDQLDADAVVLVDVADENDLSPLFYPTEYEATVAEDAPPHSSVARVVAEDADLGLNGEIYYSLEEPGDRFAVHPTSGVVTTTRRLAAAEGARYELTVLARDRASLLARGEAAPAARASLVVRVLPANLHAPEMRVRHLPALADGADDSVYAIVQVTDRDAGEHGRVAALDIVDGDPDGHFRVRPSRAQSGEFDVTVHALLDRAAGPRAYNLTLRATDAGRPPRDAYLTLPVALPAEGGAAPVFDREVYEAGVPETAPPATPVIRLKVSDRGRAADARVYIEIVGGNEGGEFRIDPDSGVLYTAAALDAERRALYTLTVSAVDRGEAGARAQSSAKVQVAVLDANDNDPVFERAELEVSVAENGAGGAVVARVTARDADSGENAYISYSIANLQPVPFEVDHFSGAVRTTRLLDYETMRREYELRVRASDWGLPYRRQAEMRLAVRLLDVNDNRPQFERVDCVGYLPRRLPIGSEIVTLSAIDFDAGDVVSYRITGGNEDGCFALDAGAGTLTLACDLADVRSETRVLNVTATDGTHFADAASLTLHLAAGAGGGGGTGGGGGPGALECRDTGVARRLTELLAAAERSNTPLDAADEFPPAPSRYGDNLHAPEFVDFPVEVKVNESVALGTALVRLRALDRDLGYNGLLVYGISGGDTDSAFRIDPDTGELQVIGHLDREREAEYYLNVTAYDLGRPQRAVSRLLPVTVLDVNDNAPRFEKTLASFRVTENALNGTVIFRAEATDRDAGAFGRVAYSLAGGEGAFCVARDSGELRVCAALDRERRALYELTLRATDGGGRRAEARVRVAVDDVNDNAPRFSPAAGGARVREDLPVGTVVAALEAHDPDSGAGGRVQYSLPDQSPEDAVFTVDPLSGTLRLAKRLDYEEKQVYGVTVRATDGGRPALWADTTLFVEVLDVDENLHAPLFPEPALAAAVREDAPVGTEVLRAAAADADPPGRDSRLAYTLLAGSGLAHFSVDDAGTLRTLAPLDREAAPHYWLTLCAQDHALAPRTACAQLYVDVLDVNDEAPWPERAAYDAAVREHSAAGVRLSRVRCRDGDAAPSPPVITYSIVAGNPDGLFSIDEKTGEIETTGRTLDREVAATHALEVRCSDGELAGAARVLVRVLDINDHAPAFTQRSYELRVPQAELQGDEPEVEAGAEGTAGGEESSTEGDDEEDEAGTGPRPPWDEADDPPAGVYVTTVLALDPDEGENGTVRYSVRARGAARGLVRVHAPTGRLHVTRALRPHEAHDLTVRACDGGRPARCGLARVGLRGAGRRRARGSPPTAAPVPPLQVAELDAPGFLLTVLQAADPDGDPLSYDIVNGDPRQEFHVGREDGSLVLARRLLWERQAAYSLNVSVSDGAHTVYSTVNVSVINDANEGGVSFSRDSYTVEVSEDARVGEPLLQLAAAVGGAAGAAGDARLLYGVLGARAPASARLFRLHELTGVLELAQPLDRESAGQHELTVWARDQAPRASRALARVLVRVRGVDEHAPAWPRRLWEARLPRGAAPGALLAPLRAADRDGDGVAYSLAGGDAHGLFAVDAALGDVRLARALPPPGAGPGEYTLHVRATGPPPRARSATLPLHVVLVEPGDAPPRFVKSEIECEVYENEPAGAPLAALEVRSAASAWFSLRGGDGLFRLNPASGALATAAPLDYEARRLYNLTVTAQDLGGGSAEARVTVRVLDRNEFAPEFEAREYRGRVAEDAAPGAAVRREDGAGPLVLEARDRDGPAHRRRVYALPDPAVASLFRVDDTTGALLLAPGAALDYEAQPRHEFLVEVRDAGEPRVPPGDASVARVVLEVTDVNDCPPVFSAPAHEETLLLPTEAGVVAARVAATDADLPPGGTLQYAVLEGDAAGAFELSAGGELRVRRPDRLAPEYRLLVRAWDGRHAATARVLLRVREPEHKGLAFQKPDYYGSVLENSTKPSTVAVLDVLGAELNEHVEFTILNPTEGFEVGVSSGAVRTTGVALDRERRDAYSLLVQARSGERRARARLHVAVADINDNCPVFVERPYAGAVRAGAAAGEPVLRVRALDADAGDNGAVHYELKRGNGELFRVDRRTGLVSLKRAPDAQAQPYALAVAAYDGGVPACGVEAPVTVRVWAGGGAPAWPQAHVALTAREDSPPGAPLGEPLRALSPLLRPLIYTLQDAPEPALFEIQFDTALDRGTNPCVLVAAGELDYEAAREHALVVRATDGVTGAHADLAVTLRLLDVNDCEPRFERDLYRAAISEAAAVGDPVLTVRATDDDSGDNSAVRYSLAGVEGEPGSAESAALFAVEAESGRVVVAAPLDAERAASHHLLLRAEDAGRPPLHTTAHLFVTVEDVNDSSPRVERGVVSAPVSSEAARGTVVARVAAWDPDAGDAARLRYAPAGPLPPALELDARTGLLSLADPRAFADAATAPRSLNVSVSDGAYAAFARVKLTLTPANRSPPRFPHLVHEARALENQPPPLLLTTVKAFDDDAGEYGAVTYSIPSAKLRETFAVDAHSGALTARRPLDREARAEWSVPVAARDGGGLLAHTTVRVRVADLNDNAPAFPLREYCAAVAADRPPGAPFLAVAARDADAGDAATLTYSVYEGDPPPATAARGLFRVDPRTGELSFARNASEFASRTLQVWVRARDGGGLAAEAPVSVHVLSAGRRAPRVAPLPPDLFLREDAPPDTLVAELRAPLDAPLAAPDEPIAAAAEPLRYRLAGGAAQETFAVDAAGRVVLTGTLDRETVPEYVIGVVAESAAGGGGAVLLQTTLHVLDVNEHAPAFHSQPYVVLLAENAPLHSSLVQLMADDADAGANGEVRYALGDGEPGTELATEWGPFSVDPYSGWVLVAGELDREARAEHRVPLRAADAAPGALRREARGTLVVRLLDYNDCAPRFQPAELRAAVREDAPPGTGVLPLRLEDADLAGAPLVLFVAAGDPGGRFALRGAELVVARPLDREVEPLYRLEVLATDGKFEARARLTVEVLDADDNPPYCARPGYRVALPEDAAPGARVAELEVLDADTAPNAQLRYELSGDGADRFAIDQSGVVTVAGALDREARALYRLQAHARAAGLAEPRAAWGCSSALRVALLDVNDNAPRFSADTYSVTLPEDADVGTLVAKVHASDADLGDNRAVRYSFAEDAAEGGAFALAADSGIVTLRAPLDRESQAEHRLRVRACDAGRPPLCGLALLRLTVADVNDNPPDFEYDAYHAAVSELAAPGGEVLRVRATSRDAGVNADVAYSIVGGDDRDDFAVDRASGVVKIARPLDFERRRQYLLTVQALDGGDPPLSDLAALNVTVVDGNDNAPVFAQPKYAARVREDAAVGSRVLQVIADDADSGLNGRIAYSIQRGDPDGRFTVDADTGYLAVAAPLDREATALYSLELRARDRGEPALEAAVRVDVEVTDANDNPPLFERANYSAVVREGRPLGHAVLRFEVRDADAPPNAAPFTFDFQAGNERGAFRLDQDGYLRSATRFNHRIKDRYALRVRVFDNGTPPLFSDAWVHVEVVEESQYPPAVTPLAVLVNSYRDEFPGGVIGRVHALDRDAYDTLAYAIAPADGATSAPTDLFEVDAATGTLRAAPRLDVGDYRLNVTVGDGKYSSFAVVEVTVALVTDEMLERAAVVRFREVTDSDFVLSHRKGFVRAVREATACEPGDVVLLSVQPSDEGEGAPARGARRERRQVARDLDVAFAVRAGREGGEEGEEFLGAEALRRLLHAHLVRLEESTRLVVEELPRGACAGCGPGACVERLEVADEAPRVVATDVFSLVAPRLVLRGRCVCAPGRVGEHCERPAHLDACAAAACEGRCEPAPEPPGYRCCDAALRACHAPRPVVLLAGDGYLAYRVERGVVDGERLLDDELTLSLRFRTRWARGTLLHAAGRVDYATLEVAEGRLQFRMELGSGPLLLRADAPVADGAWHEARLERRGATARLTLDRRVAHAQAPPPAAVLDVRADRLLLGAALVRHEHALAPEQVTHGFHGCLADVRLGGAPLPLQEGAAPGAAPPQEGAAPGAARAALLRRVRVRVAAACPPPAPPTPCSSYPCMNGGTCRETANLLEGHEGGAGGAGGAGDEGYACSCHARFLGPRCELDAEPCASAPCLHGGSCAPGAAPGSFRCACGAGLRGPRCEAGRWCAPGACRHGGVCEEGDWGPSCRCRGYYGPRCQYDVDECAGEPCLNGATCINEPGSFRCLCPPDKTGMNCGNPLYSDAVVGGGPEGGAAGGDSAAALWRWCLEARWPLGAAGALLALLLLLGAALPLALRRARRATRPPPRAPPAAHPAPLNSLAPPPEKLPLRGSKLSNLEVGRRAADRPASCADPPPAPLNNIDTLRSYGSAGDELEGIPPDYLRNLNIEPPDRKPWSEQMHLHTFVDNKIYNDLKACKPPRARVTAPPGAAGELVGGYHWDCSDWCGGGALPGISEVAGSERPDSSSPPSPASPPPARRPPGARPTRPARPRPRPPPPDTDSAPDDLDRETVHFTDASSYLLHPDEYLPPRPDSEGGRDGEGSESTAVSAPRLRRDPDAASLITMLEERRSLLGGGETGSCSDLSANLCEIEDSEEEEPPTVPAPAPTPPRHTAV